MGVAETARVLTVGGRNAAGAGPLTRHTCPVSSERRRKLPGADDSHVRRVELRAHEIGIIWQRAADVSSIKVKLWRPREPMRAFTCSQGTARETAHL